MKEKVLRITGMPKETTSGYGNYAVPCTKEITYNNGTRKITTAFLYTWTKKKAFEIVNSFNFKVKTEAQEVKRTGRY